MPGPRRDGSDHVGVVLDRQTVVSPQHPWGACDPSHGPQLLPPFFSNRAASLVFPRCLCGIGIGLGPGMGIGISIGSSRDDGWGLVRQTTN